MLSSCPFSVFHKLLSDIREIICVLVCASACVMSVDRHEMQIICTGLYPKVSSQRLIQADGLVVCIL